MSDATKPCYRCGINPRNSSLKSYCKDCQKAISQEAQARRKRQPQDFCSRCGDARDGGHPVYCAACCRARRQERMARPCITCGAARAPADKISDSYCNRCFRDRYLRRTYGIGLDEYEARLAAQRNRCAICGRKDEDWQVDHDHLTGQVRGILCRLCNTGIGQLRDDPKVLQAAFRYVSDHRQMHLF